MKNEFDHQSGELITIGTANVYVEEIPAIGKPALLFLHGGAGNIADFNPLIPAFTGDFHIVGMDARGHGRSTTGIDTLTYQRLEEDVEYILDHLKIRKVNIIGFSDGGIIGYRLAMVPNSKVEKLITIGGTWSVEDVEFTEKMLRDFTTDRWKQVMPQQVKSYEELNPEGDIDTVLEKIRAMWLDKSDSGYPKERVENIKCPTLIIRGDQDHMFPRQSAAQLADKITGSLLLNIPFVGHEIFTAQSTVFLDVVRQFLELES